MLKLLTYYKEVQLYGVKEFDKEKTIHKHHKGIIFITKQKWIQNLFFYS